MPNLPTSRQLDLDEANDLERQIRNANARLSKSEFVEPLDEAMFADLVLRFIQAAQPERVLAMVESGEIPKEHETYGTPLCLAAETGLFDLIKPLHRLDCGHYCESTGHSALSAALDNAHLDRSHLTITELLDIGAELPDSANVLRCAADSCSPTLVQMLIDRGSDPNDVCPATSYTPLYAAIAGNRMTENAPLLLRAGANPNFQNFGGRAAPLSALAAKRDDPEAIDKMLTSLLEHGLHVSGSRLNGRHPLQDCVPSANDTLACRLLELGIDPTLILPTSPIDPLERDEALLAQAFEKIAMAGLPRSVAYMVEALGCDPAQKLASGALLADHVTDAQTQSFLRSSISVSIIGHSLEPTDNTTGEVAPSRHSTLSL
jgi:hypothetical protein